MLDGGLNEYIKAATTRRIKSVSSELYQDLRTHSTNERQERPFKKLVRRRVHVVSTTLEPQHAWSRGYHERRQHSLKHQSGAAGCAYIESIFARCNAAGMKCKFS